MQEIARALEAVDFQVKKMGDGASDNENHEKFEVHKVYTKSNTPAKKKGRCYRCDQEWHFSKDQCCPARKTVCRKCQ